MIEISLKATAIFLLIFASLPAQSGTRFELGTRGYLMDACEDTLDQKNTFESGYCYGVYSSVMSSKMVTFGEIGTSWCPDGPDSLDPIVNIGIVVKWIKDHPKQWKTEEAYYAVELALKEAYPCK